MSCLSWRLWRVDPLWSQRWKFARWLLHNKRRSLSILRLMGVLRRDLDHHFVVFTLLLLKDQRLSALSIFSRRDPVCQEKQEHSGFRTNRVHFSRFENNPPSHGTSASSEVSLSCPHQRLSEENSIMSASINGVTWSSSLRVDDSSVVYPLTPSVSDFERILFLSHWLEWRTFRRTSRYRKVIIFLIDIQTNLQKMIEL